MGSILHSTSTITSVDEGLAQQANPSLLYNMCLHTRRVNPELPALTTRVTHICLHDPPELPSRLRHLASRNEADLNTHGRYIYPKGPIKELSQDLQPGEVSTQGHILDTFFVDLSKTSALHSPSPTQRHIYHDYALDGGGRLCIVLTLWIFGIVLWKLYLGREKNLGRKKLLFGLWHYTPLSSLFVRVQTDFGILSLVGGCRDGLVYCPGETR